MQVAERTPKLVFCKVLLPRRPVLPLTRHLCSYHCTFLKEESNYEIELQAKAILKLVSVHNVHPAKLL